MFLNKTKSFTLIELLIVIAIIGLLVIIIAIPINRARQGASIARILQYEASLHRYLGADIVGWWKLDGDLNDTTRNNNHGTWGGSGDPQYVDGVPGKGGDAISFDGSSEKYIFGTINKLGENNLYTLSAWVKLSGKTGGSWQVPFGWGSQSSGDLINIAYNNSQLYLTCDRWTASASPYKYYEGLYSWVFISCIYNGSELLQYINGEYSGSWDVAAIPNSNNFRIGQGPDGGFPFNGLISDIRIYSRALTSEEINTLYTETKNKYITEEL